MEEYLWLVLAIIFGVGEVIVPGLISIWFAISAGILALLSKHIVSLTNEFYIFLGLSVIFLILTRPLSKKLLSKRKDVIEDRIIGKIIKIDEVLEDDNYQVRLDGKYWRAISKDKLEVGEEAKVLKIEGIKLILEKE